MLNETLTSSWNYFEYNPFVTSMSLLSRSIDTFAFVNKKYIFLKSVVFPVRAKSVKYIFSLVKKPPRDFETDSINFYMGILKKVH